MLNDESGNEVPFEFLDLIKYENEEYVVLLPEGDEAGAKTPNRPRLRSYNDNDLEGIPLRFQLYDRKAPRTSP